VRLLLGCAVNRSVALDAPAANFSAGFCALKGLVVVSMVTPVFVPCSPRV